ncbi:MAG TPA: hypothetical protein EYH20_04505, partial [Leucothrix sp.]|nr:hypothetical protein [Leucothrix sp.]
MTFTALSLYTHFLSPDEYGVYTLIMSATILLHNVIYNWLPVGVLRFWASEQYNKLEFTSTLATGHIRITLGLFIIMAIGVIFYWQKPEASWIISSFTFLLALALFNITQSLFSAKIEPQYYAYMAISSSIFALVLGSTYAYLGFGATGVLA